jgi:hypothetical protein
VRLRAGVAVGVEWVWFCGGKGCGRPCLEDSEGLGLVSGGEEMGELC